MTDINASDVIKRMSRVLNTNQDNELAEVLGVAAQTIATWKKRNKIPYEQVIEVAEATGVTTDYLLLGKEDNQAETTAQKNTQAVREWAENVVTSQLLVHIYEKLNAEMPLFEQLSAGDSEGFFYTIWSSYCTLMRQLSPSDYEPSNWDNLIIEVDKILEMDIRRFNSLVSTTKSSIERANAAEKKSNLGDTTQHISGSNHEIAGRDINKGK